MKKIANSSELSRYYSDVNRYIDEYISSYRVSPTEIFRYINKNMSRFLEKFGIKDVENIDKIVRDVIEHRRNMEKDKVINVANNSENSSNKDLVEVRDFLIEEYTETKNLIIDLTKHLDGIEELYNKVNDELEKRIK